VIGGSRTIEAAGKIYVIYYSNLCEQRS